jgi:nucleotide-binding universal stress UspA family protein
MITLKNILVATDFSEPSDAALLYGRNFARQHGATLHVLHIVDDAMAHAMTPVGIAPDIGEVQMELEADAERRLNELVTDEDRVRLHARTAIRTSGWPASAILAYAKDEEVDLIIVGTHGRTGLAHFFLGSVAQQVVRSAPCPVLTVRHPEREFAIPDALQSVSQTARRSA